MSAHDEEKMKLEEHASKVAQTAAEALRQSCILRSLDSISVPTWTGKSGAAGAPSAARGKFGSTINSSLVSISSTSEEAPKTETSRVNGFAAGTLSGIALSSAEMLARIKGNRENALGDAIDHQFDTALPSNQRKHQSFGNRPARSSNNSRVQPEILIRQICTFVQQKGGRISPASIVDHFKDKIPSEDLPLFKNLIKELATLEKNPNGSNWVLKPEYKYQ